MSIRYKFSVLPRLKEAGYNTNRIRKEKLFSESTLQKFRRGEYISFENVNTLCRLLHIQPGDLLEYAEDDIPKEPGPAQKTFLSESPEETEALGRRLGEAILREGGRRFIAMYGDLGAGKTVFVRGLASVLSPGSRVKSPTYTLVNEYRKGALPLFHFDLYRIADAGELDGFGFDEYVAGGVCVSEWSENLGGALPENAVSVRIEKRNDNERRITVENFPEELL